MNRQRTTLLVAAAAALAAAIAVVALGVRNATSPATETSAPQQQEALIPAFLKNSFPTTDWSRADPALTAAQSGGPPKDGIPAIDDPRFEPVSGFAHGDDVQAILIEGATQAKAYPYNILIWHEIVNDTVDGDPVAVTFCPLCGSAIVYDRTLPDGSTTTFGVSGGLLESNMIMFDRSTETLWQQSTGKALAGKNYPHQLSFHKFQLLTVGDIKTQFPTARILSEDTGYSRDYSLNPYGDYDDSENFYFRPSHVDERYQAKAIFVAFSVNDSHVAAPWLALEEGRSYTMDVNGETVTLQKKNSQMTVVGHDGTDIPFYFEMWFSWAIQNDDGEVFDPR